MHIGHIGHITSYQKGGVHIGHIGHIGHIRHIMPNMAYLRGTACYALPNETRVVVTAAPRPNMSTAVLERRPAKRTRGGGRIKPYFAYSVNEAYFAYWETYQILPNFTPNFRLISRLIWSKSNIDHSSQFFYRNLCFLSLGDTPEIAYRSRRWERAFPKVTAMAAASLQKKEAKSD